MTQDFCLCISYLLLYFISQGPTQKQQHYILTNIKMISISQSQMSWYRLESSNRPTVKSRSFYQLAPEKESWESKKHRTETEKDKQTLIR